MCADQVKIDVGEQVASGGAVAAMSYYGHSVVATVKSAAVGAANLGLAPVIGIATVVGVGVYQYGEYKKEEMKLAQLTEHNKMVGNMIASTRCPDGFYPMIKNTNDTPVVTCEEPVGFKEKVSVVSSFAEKACGGTSNYLMQITSTNDVTYQCIHLHGDSTADVFI